MKKIPVLVLLTFCCALTYGQRSLTDSIFAVIETKINQQYQLVDSLPKAGYNEYMKASFHLTAKEVKEIKQWHEPGKSLPKSWLPQMQRVDGGEFFKMMLARNQNDNYFRQHPTLYYISNPILFSNCNKAIVQIDLFGRQGIGYLLIKVKGKWRIEKEYIRWVS